jgi:septal ring-binding cell division protein DamX
MQTSYELPGRPARTGWSGYWLLLLPLAAVLAAMAWTPTLPLAVDAPEPTQPVAAATTSNSGEASVPDASTVRFNEAEPAEPVATF